MTKQSKCEYCGKPYTKTHGNQKYCSKKCRKNAKREQVAHSRLRTYYKNKNQKKIKQYGLGTGSLGQHKNPDNNQEYQLIRKELQRLKIK